jgi:hypothetical protein
VEPPLLEVRMNEGGVLKGLVVDEAGKPLPGVAVTTLPKRLRRRTRSRRCSPA